MANKRDTSKQKRARQNRAQRAAREARSTKANEPKRPSRAAPTKKGGTKATEPAPRSARTGGGSSADEEPRGFFAKARAERGPRPGDVPVELDELEGGWFTKRIQVPGGRQVVTGAILTLVITVMTAVATFPQTAEDAPEDLEGAALVAHTALPMLKQSLFSIYGPLAAVGLAVPCLVYLAAMQFTLSPLRRRVWIAGSFVIALVALAGVAFFVYVFPAGFLVYAVWKANRVEGPARPRRGRRGAGEDVDEASDGDAEAAADEA